MAIRFFRQHRSAQQRFQDLLRPHIDLMYRMAWRWTQSEADAEDIVQDVLLRLSDRVEEMEAVEKLRPWLIRIVYRRYIDWYRSRKSSPVWFESALDREEVEDADILFQNFPDERDELGQDILREKLHHAIETLDEDQRQVILLHDVEGYSAMEAAEILGESPGTIKSRLHRARKKLKNFLEEGTF